MGRRRSAVNEISEKLYESHISIREVYCPEYFNLFNTPDCHEDCNRWVGSYNMHIFKCIGKEERQDCENFKNQVLAIIERKRQEFDNFKNQAIQEIEARFNQKNLNPDEFGLALWENQLLRQDTRGEVNRTKDQILEKINQYWECSECKKIFNHIVRTDKNICFDCESRQQKQQWEKEREAYFANTQYHSTTTEPVNQYWTTYASPQSNEYEYRPNYYDQHSYRGPSQGSNFSPDGKIGESYESDLKCDKCGWRGDSTGVISWYLLNDGKRFCEKCFYQSECQSQWGKSVENDLSQKEENDNQQTKIPETNQTSTDAVQPPSSPDQSPQNSPNSENLEDEQALQNQQAESQKQNIKDGETSQGQKSFSESEHGKQFNWLYVVIPMGIVIIGLLFLLLRKEKKLNN